MPIKPRYPFDFQIDVDSRFNVYLDDFSAFLTLANVTDRLSEESEQIFLHFFESVSNDVDFSRLRFDLK